MSQATQTPPNSETQKKGFWQWLTEDDSPEIGIATKESLPEYIRGVKSEFLHIEWPSREQVYKEFFTVLVIVAIISAAIYVIDLGLDSLIKPLTGR